MRISSAFPSTYLKAADLQGRRVKVTMQHVAMEDIGGELKPILYFLGKEKGLVLNKTNANTIVHAYGDSTEDWNGAQIELYEAMVEFQGRQVQAIRIHVPRMQAAAPPPKPAAPEPAPQRMPNGATPVSAPVGTVIDDEIPF